jgi:hypothetical protein
MQIVHLLLLFPLRFCVFFKSCPSSKRWYQHFVAPDGFTLTASFCPLFTFTASCQLILFHGHCTGNVQFKLITAVLIIEPTVTGTEDSSGKTICNSNKKKATAETIQQEQQPFYLKTDQNYLLVEHVACSKVLGVRAHRHCEFTLRAPYLLGVVFRMYVSCCCFLCSSSVYFSPVQNTVGFREVCIHVLDILNGAAHLCDCYKAGNLLWRLMISYKWSSVIRL